VDDSECLRTVWGEGEGECVENAETELYLLSTPFTLLAVLEVLPRCTGRYLTSTRAAPISMGTNSRSFRDSVSLGAAL
jgi:hypothetical protein